MLLRQTASVLQVCQPGQHSTQISRCSLPRAALCSTDIPTATALSLEVLLHLPETQGKLTLAGVLPIVAATKTIPASLKLSPVYIRNIHTVLKSLTALPTIENSTENHQQIIFSNCIQFWLPKLKHQQKEKAWRDS